MWQIINLPLAEVLVYSVSATRSYGLTGSFTSKCVAENFIKTHSFIRLQRMCFDERGYDYYYHVWPRDIPLSKFLRGHKLIDPCLLEPVEVECE